LKGKMKINKYQNHRDHMTLELLGKNKELYGKQRIFGGIAWGIVALATGTAVQFYGINSSAYLAALFAIP